MKERLTIVTGVVTKNGTPYALQFIHMDMREKSELEDWIFKAQRGFLRKRNLLTNNP